MLKNRSTSYILIPVVAVLWGVVIYKYVSGLSNDTSLPQAYAESTFKIPKTTQKETFNLIPIERDPFLGTLYKSNIKAKKKVVAPLIVWPKIIYKGIVKGEKKSAFIVQINGQDQIFNRGEELNGIKLVRGNSEKVMLRYEGSTKEFNL